MRSRLPVLVVASAALLFPLLPPAGRAEPGEGPLVVAGREVQLDAGRFAAVPGTVHAVVALGRIPTDADRAALDSLGVVLHQYLPDLAWFATVPAGRAPALLALPFVRAAEPFRPEWKAPPEVAADPAAWMRLLPDGRSGVHVYFFPDTTLEEARTVLERLGGVPSHEGFEVNERIAAALPPEVLPALLREDAVRWIEDANPERATCNAQAAYASGVDRAQASPLGLTGRDVRVGVMDEDHAQGNHGDFGSRVTVVETYGSAYGSHATHVTGTILGSGQGSASAKGMAPAALAWTWSFYGDVIGKKRNGFSNYGIRADSNSWGSVIGWRRDATYGWVYTPNTSRFGAYEGAAADLDTIIASSGTLVDFAAGNDGTDTGTTSGHYDASLSTGQLTWHTGSHAADGGGDGYGSSSPDSAGKNGICVASMTETTRARSAFSSNGPAKDGRLKPDLTAVGERVYSTVPVNSHGTMSGTSMATPVVTGVAALAIEAWRGSHGGADPRVDVLKGLLCHTAGDIGRPGPDYDTGFGVVDAYRAAKTAIDDGASSLYHRTATATHGSTQEYAVAVTDASTPLVATLCWTDRAGNPAGAKALVNDLDVVLRSPSGALVYPWKLDPASPSSNAGRGVNVLDNVEKVEVATPATGTWTILVKGSVIPSGSQAYALWFSQPSSGAGAAGPTAKFGGDVTVAATSPAGVTLTLDGSASTDPDGPADIVSWTWDLDGDGSFTDAGGSASGKVVQAAFPIGARDVTLRVADAAGHTGSATAKVTVRNDAPVADLGADRTIFTPDATGAVLTMDSSLCTDPQTRADIVSWAWDLDGDGQYDDATVASPQAKFGVKTRTVGVRLRDTLGLEATDSMVLTVATAENVLSNGGSGPGTLSTATDRDTFLVQALQGGSVTVVLKASFPYRLRLRGPLGESLLDATGTTNTTRTVTAPGTGWHWVELSAASTTTMTRSYTISISVQPPPLSGASASTLTAGEPEESVPVLLGAGSRLRARLRQSREGSGGAPVLLQLLDPEGNLLAEASAGRPLRLDRAPVTGTYRFRVYSPSGALDYEHWSLGWTVRAPRGRERIREQE